MSETAIEPQNEPAAPEFGFCSYIDCKNPAIYKWYGESDKPKALTCRKHSLLICQLYNNRNSGNNDIERKYNKDQYKACLDLAKTQMEK